MNAAGNEPPLQPLFEPLTRREREILELLAEGLTAPEMAERLTLAVSSVRWYLQQIYGKLGVDGKRQAIARAQERGILPSAPTRPAALPVSNPPAPQPEPRLPTGTVTFLFTDIEGSTPLWEKTPEEMRTAVALHHALLREAIEASGGMVFQIIGDAFQAAFPLAAQGVSAAVEVQRRLTAAQWPAATGPLKVRMGLHIGPASLDERGGYAVSHTLNRVARVMSAGHGGQILLSQEMKDLLERCLPDGMHLKDLGEHRLKGLSIPEHLYQVSAPGLLDEFPPLATAIQHLTNIPSDLTSFIGRESVIVDLAGRITCDTCRLLTLTGSGGAGKTRLALQLGKALLGQFPAGVWLVELAPLTDPEKVAQATAAALGLQESGGAPILDVLTDYLKPRAMLLLLDNCEHLIEAAARLVEHLLRASPGLRILATSREALGIPGEAAFRVPSLAAPAPDDASAADSSQLLQFEAVRLLVERAALVQPGFSLTPANARPVAQICHRLDGIPLAIELAAARAGSLSMEQIAARLNDRFRLLTGGSRTALPRQQTLRASVDWSYSLLSKSEKLLLQRLSIFAGGWLLEAAEQVCGFGEVDPIEVVDTLGALVRKSLVVFSDSSDRYWLLETVRQYAREKLAAENLLDESGGEEARRRHLAYYLRLAQQAEPELVGYRRVEWVDRLTAEVDNMRAALEWGLEDDRPESALAGARLIWAADLFLQDKGLMLEGLRWVEEYQARLAQQGQLSDSVRAPLIYMKGEFTLAIGDYQAGKEIIGESVALYRCMEEPYWLAHALALHAHCTAWLGDVTTGLQEIDEAIQIAINKGVYEQQKTRTLYFKIQMGLDLDAGRPLLEEGLAQSEKMGRPVESIACLRHLGVYAVAQDDEIRARVYLKKALEMSRTLNCRQEQTWNLIVSGWAAYHFGHFEEMEPFFHECQAVSEEVGFRFGYVISLNALSVAARYLGQPERAASLALQSLERAQEYHFMPLILETLVPLAVILIEYAQEVDGNVQLDPDLPQSTEGRLSAAARLLSAAQALSKHNPLDGLPGSELHRGLEKVNARLSMAAFAAACREGEALTLEQAAAEARRAVEECLPAAS